MKTGWIIAAVVGVAGAVAAIAFLTKDDLSNQDNNGGGNGTTNEFIQLAWVWDSYYGDRIHNQFYCQIMKKIVDYYYMPLEAASKIEYLYSGGYITMNQRDDGLAQLQVLLDNPPNGGP